MIRQTFCFILAITLHHALQGQLSECIRLQYYACYEPELAPKKDLVGKEKWKFEINNRCEASSLPLYFLSDRRNPMPGKFNEELLIKWMSPENLFRWTFRFEDRSDLLVYPDSIAEMNFDLSKLSARTELKMKRVLTSAHLELSAESSKFRKSNMQSTANGVSKKVPQSASLSPGIVRCQSGLSYNSKKGNRLEMGVPALRLAWIRLRELYDLNNTDEIMGIKREEPFDFEGGMSMNSEFGFPDDKKWKFEHRAWFFYPFHKEGQPEARMENRFSFKIKENLKASLSSRFTYDQNRWPPGLWITEMSILWEQTN